MNILFVSALFPYPLYSGGQVRIFNLLKLLSHNHSITLYAFIRDFKELEYISKLPFLHRVKLFYRGKAMQFSYIIRSLTGQYPLLLTSYDNRSMKGQLQNELNTHTYDLVHLEPFYVWPSLPQTRLPVVVAEHNIEYEVYKQYVELSTRRYMSLLLQHDVKKIQRWEHHIWSKAAHITAVSCHDAEIISTYISDKKVSIISNGVDTEYYSYFDRTLNRSKARFLFIGNFAWVPNQQAARTLLKDIWPKILYIFPTAKLTIVGTHMPVGLIRYTHQKGIMVKENVLDIRNEYRQSHALLSPALIAGGTKFKLLEAMASGTPVISSKESLMGLDIKAGHHVAVAQTAKDYIQKITDLYENPKHWITMARRARLLIEKKYDWKTIACRLSAIWEQTK